MYILSTHDFMVGLNIPSASLPFSLRYILSMHSDGRRDRKESSGLLSWLTKGSSVPSRNCRQYKQVFGPSAMVCSERR